MQKIFDSTNSEFWKLLGWVPNQKQIEQFKNLQILLSSWNKKVNLTRIIEGEDYWVSQIFDSLWPLKNELHNPLIKRNCIDIGTGCGFPGLAIAIALPKTNMTLVDASNKKTNILEAISKELNLSSRIQIKNQRAEELGRDLFFRGKFDLAMARAVAPAPTVAEYLIPLIQRNGEALIYRGKWVEGDEDKLIKSLISLKGKIKSIQTKQLPANKGERNLIRLKSIEECPKKYPRAIGIPSKRPLGS